MSLAIQRPHATIADLLAIPTHQRFHEVIDGELVQKAQPTFRHGSAQAGLSGRLSGPYNRRAGGGGPGGWRFATETEILFGESQVYRPDVAGWRRERLPELPQESPVTVLPDWVCEILSPSNERNDVVKKMRTYHRSAIPHYWVLDPLAETLLVYRWSREGYVLALSAEGEERVQAEPFDAVTLSVRGLVDGEAEDQGA